jgi:hypothetical protein
MKATIPTQFEGKSFDYHKHVELATSEEAGLYYERIRLKLLEVNKWHEIATVPIATFTIKDKSGRKLQRPVQKGDFVQIDIPGPGLPSADGYDWVEVVNISETKNSDGLSFLITLRPASDPTEANADIAHFFTKLATSSILVEQKGTNIHLHYAGRNEIINTENEGIMDNVRNFLVGVGAKLGASFPQWKALVDGLVKIEGK